MRKVIGIVVAIVVVVGLRFYNRGTDEKAVLADMKTVIAQLGASPADSAYLNGVLDREHSRAFDAAYEMGSRRRGARFDENKYVDAIFKAMISQCEKDKKKDLAAKLRIAHEALRSAEKK
jgi:hypothetical protein